MKTCVEATNKYYKLAVNYFKLLLGGWFSHTWLTFSLQQNGIPEIAAKFSNDEGYFLYIVNAT